MRVSLLSERLSKVTSLLVLVVASCGGGGGGSDGGGGTPGAPLELVAVEPPTGTELAWDTRLEFSFSAPLDPYSVSSDAVRIRTTDGAPAVGTFLLENGNRRLVFAPRCPLEADGSDAGLLPGAAYAIELVGGDLPPSTPRLASTAGQGLAETATLAYTTAAFAGGPVLTDPVAGPPALVVRPVGSTLTAVSRVDVGGLPRWFELDPATQTVAPVAGLPRQLRADPAGRFAVQVVFDQPLAAGETNLARIVLERQVTPGTWRAVPSERVLEDNGCVGGGARVRLEPTELLPALADLRVAVRAGLVDVAGEATTADDLGTLVLSTGTVPSPAFEGYATFGDEVREEFVDLDLREPVATHGDPLADWSGGRLAPGAAFAGTGGPGGDFDWIVAPGEDLVLDTAGGTILGGPGFTRTGSQTTTDGRFECRDVWIQEGGSVFVVGPNPLEIFASGDFVLDGRIVASGADAPSVVRFAGGDASSPGGVGSAGGGDGGWGSPDDASSSVRGSDGEGPLGRSTGGGRGGETGYGEGLPRNFLGAGGGGGRFARNQGDLIAGAGQGGGASSTGASSGLSPAGGAAGQPVFVDTDPTNDFWGRRWIPSVARFEEGELAGLTAGAGGGGGGDAIPTGAFPSTLTGDLLGGGGGGGGGGVRLVVAGDLTFGTSGQIHADGGQGATGEYFSTAYPVAGGGGGGSGGHVVLEVGGRFDGRSLAADGITALGGRPSQSTSPSVSPNSCGGGRGGPGVIQIHVRDPLTDLLLPVPAVSLASRTEPNAEVLWLSFGPASRARSRWLAFGSDVTDLEFHGVDASGAFADADADGVRDLARPFVGPLPAVATGAPRFEDPDVVTFPAAPLVGTELEVLLANPRLLERTLVTVEVDGFAPERHPVAAAEYAAAEGLLRVTLEAARPGALPAGARLALRPRDHALLAQGDEALAGVLVLFQGTGASAAGDPDPFAATAWTADPGELVGSDFVRFDVRFDRGALAAGRPAEDLALDFLRLPFRFQ